MNRALSSFPNEVAKLQGLLDQLRSAESKVRADHKEIPREPGVYLFSDAERPRYVGRTKNLRQRLAQHTHQSGSEMSASLAFLIARGDAELAGKNHKGTRRSLVENPDLRVLFERAKAKVGKMKVQFVCVPDPVTRALLEIYASLELGTEDLNSFEEH